MGWGIDHAGCVFLASDPHVVDRKKLYATKQTIQIVFGVGGDIMDLLSGVHTYWRLCGVIADKRDDVATH